MKKLFFFFHLVKHIRKRTIQTGRLFFSSFLRAIEHYQKNKEHNKFEPKSCKNCLLKNVMFIVLVL